jgi:copper chaperone
MLQTYEVCNIKCGGCANTVTKALNENGFTGIDVDLSCEPRKVTVDIQDESQLTQLRAVLKKLGYPFCDEEMGIASATALKAKSFVSCAVGKMSSTDDTEKKK